MKLVLYFTLLLGVPGNAFGSVSDILELRKLYYSSAESKANTEELVLRLENVTEESSTIYQGYKGMSLLLTAKHSWNPLDKVSYFLKGVKWLETSIEGDPKNVELRFLRYSVQSNAPSFLNYYSEIENDRSFITANYKELNDEDLKTRISNYLKDEKKK